MSNHLAIATVTATLRDLVFAAVSADVPGANVTMVKPDGVGSGVPATGVNIFLYQVTPSAAARNEDLPTRSENGTLVRRPRVGLDLHYLLTFYGAEAQLIPQRLLGSAARVLHARPVLTRAQVNSSVAARAFLAGSNLAADIELVKLTQLPLTLEDAVHHPRNGQGVARGALEALVGLLPDAVHAVCRLPGDGRDDREQRLVCLAAAGAVAQSVHRDVPPAGRGRGRRSRG